MAIEVKIDGLDVGKIEKLVQVVLQAEIEGPRRKRTQCREFFIGNDAGLDDRTSLSVCLATLNAGFNKEISSRIEAFCRLNNFD